MRLSNIQWKPKLVTIFLLVGIVPLAVATFVAYSIAKVALDEASQSAAEAVREEVNCSANMRLHRHFAIFMLHRNSQWEFLTSH